MENFLLSKKSIDSVKNFKDNVRVLGIDLGTTNSLISEILWSPSKNEPVIARCIEVSQDTLEGIYTHFLVPSIVALYEGKIYIGEGAKRLKARSADYKLIVNKNLFFECKNDMGILKTYNLAPDGFRSAPEISAKILEFLINSAMQYNPSIFNKVVITVPASFQSAQRNDTLKAAKLANIEISNGGLLDEPIAAFLDFIFINGISLAKKFDVPKIILVFDFGGGTCDVAIFRVQFVQNLTQLKISPLSVSRYHRLGGGDIDRSIVYEILIPQLIEQNNLPSNAFEFEDKKYYLEPQLSGIAEALKIGLCDEISRLKSFNKFDPLEKDKIFKIQPGIYECKIKNRSFPLKSPKLSLSDFDRIISHFLDTELLYARETEYYLTCSIFAPIQDSLDRCKLSPNEINYCLMVGGSSLIPHVIEALGNFFKKAEILRYEDKDSLQLAIARGASYHAFLLTILGKSIITHIAHDDISIKSENGLVRLISKGTTLPFPSDGSYEKNYDLAIPKTVISEKLKLRLELLDGQEHPLFSAIWEIPPPLNKGDELCLEYNYNENQIFSLKIKIKGREEELEAIIENPLTNVVNPHAKMLEIFALEEEIRTGNIPEEKIHTKLIELSEKYDEIEQTEKAIFILKKALNKSRRPDITILNKLGILYGKIFDYEREEKFYLEASKYSSWKGPLFNLSLSLYKRKQFEKARKYLDDALKYESTGPYYTLMAKILEEMGMQAEATKYLKLSFQEYGSPSSMTDWELGWFLTAAQMAQDNEKITQAREELNLRIRSSVNVEKEGVLPIITQALKKI